MIFVASTLAFTGVPAWSAYAASKAQTLVFAEGLAQELRPAGISVLAVCPGPTRTELWPAGAKPRFAMEPDAVVDLALNALGRKTTVVAGWLNAMIAVATRLLPRSWNARIYGRVIGGMLGGLATPAPPRTKELDCAGSKRGQALS